MHNVEIKGYQISHAASKTSKAGTAVYVDENVNSIERIHLNILHDEFEGTWVEIKNKHSKNIICGCIYRHPHNNFKEFFQYLELEMCLSKLNKENKEIFLAGDFNFDLLKTETDTNTQNFYDLMCSYGTLPQIIQPTRVTPNTATIIDNIFTNNITDDIICGNILLTFAEHLSQLVSVNRGKIDYKKINIYERDYSKFTVESFRDDLSIQNWDLTLDDANDSFKDFHMKLEGAVNRHAPMRKLNPKEIKIKNKPWMTPHIVKQIKLRNKIFERKKRQPENENIQIVFKQLRNRINREISKAKIKYYTQYFDEYKNNTKKIWEGIRKIVNLKKVSQKTSQLHIDGKIIDDDKDIATSLNTFFFQKLVQLLRKTSLRCPTYHPLNF